jgi:hypothetical protein
MGFPFERTLPESPQGKMLLAKAKSLPVITGLVPVIQPTASAVG